MKVREIKNKIERSLLGEESFWEEKYRNLYGLKDHSQRVKSTKKSILSKYCIAIAVFLILFFISVISESSQSPALIAPNKSDKITVERPKEGEEPLRLDLKMVIETQNGPVSKDIQVVVDAKQEKEVVENSTEGTVEKETYSEKLEKDMRAAIRTINADTTESKAVLPQKLSSGEKITWEETSSSDIPVLLVGFLMILFFIFRTRFDKIDKEAKEAKESIIRELPEFINKIILLLNAGVVLNTAFITAVEDRNLMAGDRKNYFYDQLTDIYTKVTQANGSINEEFKNFSKRSGVRELMRFSNILNDNIKKGSDLVEKLQRESESLWFARKKQSEERGRIAETKMTFPLVILLIVLVMITIAPAMLEM